eukprot:gene22679-biopygen7223
MWCGNASLPASYKNTGSRQIREGLLLSRTPSKLTKGSLVPGGRDAIAGFQSRAGGGGGFRVSANRALRFEKAVTRDSRWKTRLLPAPIRINHAPGARTRAPCRPKFHGQIPWNFAPARKKDGKMTPPPAPPPCARPAHRRRRGCSAAQLYPTPAAPESPRRPSARCGNTPFGVIP